MVQRLPLIPQAEGVPLLCRQGVPHWLRQEQRALDQRVDRPAGGGDQDGEGGYQHQGRRTRPGTWVTLRIASGGRTPETAVRILAQEAARGFHRAAFALGDPIGEESCRSVARTRA